MAKRKKKKKKKKKLFLFLIYYELKGVKEKILTNYTISDEATNAESNRSRTILSCYSSSTDAFRISLHSSGHVLFPYSVLSMVAEFGLFNLYN